MQATGLRQGGRLAKMFYESDSEFVVQRGHLEYGKGSEHNHIITILDNDQLDTHLLYFTIRLL